MRISPSDTDTFDEFKVDMLCKIFSCVFMSYFNLFMVTFEEIGKTNMLQSILTEYTINNCLNLFMRDMVWEKIHEIKGITNMKVKVKQETLVGQFRSMFSIFSKYSINFAVILRFS